MAQTVIILLHGRLELHAQEWQILFISSLLMSSSRKKLGHQGHGIHLHLHLYLLNLIFQETEIYLYFLRFINTEVPQVDEIFFHERQGAFIIKPIINTMAVNDLVIHGSQLGLSKPSLLDWKEIIDCSHRFLETAKTICNQPTTSRVYLAWSWGHGVCTQTY